MVHFAELSRWQTRAPASLFGSIVVAANNDVHAEDDDDHQSSALGCHLVEVSLPSAAWTEGGRYKLRGRWDSSLYARFGDALDADEDDDNDRVLVDEELEYFAAAESLCRRLSHACCALALDRTDRAGAGARPPRWRVAADRALLLDGLVDDDDDNDDDKTREMSDATTRPESSARRRRVSRDSENDAEDARLDRVVRDPPRGRRRAGRTATPRDAPDNPSDDATSRTPSWCQHCAACSRVFGVVPPHLEAVRRARADFERRASTLAVSDALPASLQHQILRTDLQCWRCLLAVGNIASRGAGSRVSRHP